MNAPEIVIPTWWRLPDRQLVVDLAGRWRVGLVMAEAVIRSAIAAEAVGLRRCRADGKGYELVDRGQAAGAVLDFDGGALRQVDRELRLVLRLPGAPAPKDHPGEISTRLGPGFSVELDCRDLINYFGYLGITQKKAAGAKSRFNWTKAAIFGGAWLYAGGLPEQQAELEAALADHFLRAEGREPAMSLIRPLARELITTFRAAVEGGNSIAAHSRPTSPSAPGRLHGDGQGSEARAIEGRR